MDTEPDPRTAGLIRTQIGLLVKANIKTLWPIATASKLLFCVFACGLGIATCVLQLRGSCRQALASRRRFQPPGRGCAPADGRPGRPARRVCFVDLFRFHYCSFNKTPRKFFRSDLGTPKCVTLDFGVPAGRFATTRYSQGWRRRCRGSHSSSRLTLDHRPAIQRFWPTCSAAAAPTARQTLSLVSAAQSRRQQRRGPRQRSASGGCGSAAAAASTSATSDRTGRTELARRAASGLAAPPPARCRPPAGFRPRTAALAAQSPPTPHLGACEAG